jgi:hypothetical protein
MSGLAEKMLSRTRLETIYVSLSIFLRSLRFLHAFNETETYIRFPQTLRVFYRGGHEASMLDSLEGDHLGKLVLLYGPGEVPLELKRLPVSFLTVENLFMVDPTVTSSVKVVRASQPSAPFYPSVVTNGGLISPGSPSNHGPKLIDSSLPLHKQVPPPCNEHYLMSCSKGASCKYSHDYVLTPEQLASLAVNAKKAPCNWLKNGLTCPYGQKCCWGHFCPNGMKCYHMSKGKCWFKGEAMHKHEGNLVQPSPTASSSQLSA